jgi:hypothetical protein
MTRRITALLSMILVVFLERRNITSYRFQIRFYHENFDNWVNRKIYVMPRLMFK